MKGIFVIFILLNINLPLFAFDKGRSNNEDTEENRFTWMIKMDPLHVLFRGIGSRVYFTPMGSNITLFGGATVIPSSMGFKGPFSVVDGLIYYIPLNFIVTRNSTFYDLQGEMEPLGSGFAIELGILLGKIDDFIYKRLKTELFLRFIKGNTGITYDIFYGGLFGSEATVIANLQEIGSRFTVPILRTNPKYNYVFGLDLNFGGAIGLLRWERYYYNDNYLQIDYIPLFDLLLNFNLFISF